MRVCALVTDLMDRSRITAVVPEIVFVRGIEACADADVVVVDFERFGDDIAGVRAAAPSARIVCFGPHVDELNATAARAAGADVVLPRSRFFQDPAAAISASGP